MKKTIPVHFAVGHSSGNIDVRAIIKQFEDGTHYFIATASTKHFMHESLTNHDCQLAFMTMTGLLYSPMRLRESSWDSRAQHFSRGIGKPDDLQHYSKMLDMEFEYADELYSRLKQYDDVMKLLESPLSKETNDHQT